MVVDRSRPRELAHARSQAGRLRRAGFGVVGLSGALGDDARRSIGVVHGVGAGAWRSARRLGRRSGKPVLYDHPMGETPPRGFVKADGVIASTRIDAVALQQRLRNGMRAVLVPPDLPSRCGRRAGIRPRLRQRLGVRGGTMAMHDAADLSWRQAEALLRAIAAIEGLDLVLLGGARWKHKGDLQAAAEALRVGDRVHLVAGAPATRRVDYLGQADIGLALVEGGVRRGALPATEIFESLGIPFVTVPALLGPDSVNGIASNVSPEQLRAAITEASGRERMPTREEGYRILQDLITEIAAPDGRSSDGASDAAERREPNATGGGADSAMLEERGGADALLARANLLRDGGDRDGAAALYGRVAVDSLEPTAIATAAAALARLDVREEARTAIERAMSFERRPALATARAGETAAMLGDLVRARACAEEVVTGHDAPKAGVRNAIRVLEQAGEPRAALRVARRIGDEPGIARIEGTLKSYDPSWLPVGGGPSLSLRPRIGRSLALLETSLPHVRSGYTYRARILLRAQRQAGMEPIALTRLGFPSTRGLSAPSREEVDGVVHHRVGMPNVKHYTSVPITEQLETNVRWAADRAREYRPEGIIAATPHLNGLVGLALRRELGIPLVYDVRGFPEMTWAVRRGGGDTDAFALRRVAETRCMREADLVITLSETMREHIISRGISSERVFVLPHAIDTDTLAPRERDWELATKLGLGKRPVVGYISSLVPYEGVETLIDAIAIARRGNPDIAGLIVGSGELLPSLEARAERLGLDGHVVFAGRVEASEVMRYYSLTDVFVCPRHDHEVTRYVTPLKPFEAMAAGSCIAVSDLPTLREVVRDGECGALFPPGDTEALAETIVDLIGSPERVSVMTGAARSHVLAGHGLDTLSSRFEALWAELRLRSGVPSA